MRTAGGFAPPPIEKFYFQTDYGGEGPKRMAGGSGPQPPHNYWSVQPSLIICILYITNLSYFIYFILFIYSIYFILHSPTCSIDFFPQPSVLFIFSLTSFHWLATWHLFPGPETWETHKRIHSTIASSDGSLYDWPHLLHGFQGFKVCFEVAFGHFRSDPIRALLR